MKYLGVDYGAKRVGIAISDDRGDFSYPHSVIENSGMLLEMIAQLCKDEKVTEVVIGESRDFSQKENEIMREITPFAESLRKKTGLPVHLHPEFMSSMEAERLQGHNEMHDASAAAIILKSYLESNKQK